MAVAATLKPFTTHAPTMIVLSTSDNFDGTAQTGTPAVAGGIVTYPAQAGGGKFKFHDKPIIIMEAYFDGAGSVSILKKVNETSTLSIELSSLNDVLSMTLLPGEWLEFSSTGGGAKNLLIKAQELPVALGV